MIPPIALQLYSVRDALQENFDRTIHDIAKMGYLGVETAGFPGTTPSKAAKLFSELNLQVAAAHTQLPLGDKKAEILELLDALQCKHLVLPWQPPELFASRQGIQKVVDDLIVAHETLKPRNIHLSYHNHWAEMQQVDGKPALFIMAEMLPDEITFELDTYWAKVGGVDPSEAIRTLGKRTPLLHIKDGSTRKEDPMVAVGDGVMDIISIAKASENNTEWFIVELDRCATDMMIAVAKSCRFLMDQGLALGRTT